MSTKALSDLITAAVHLAGDIDKKAHGGRMWQMEGGRRCPIGWYGCSQAVYVDLITGEHDYGEPGGPGHDDCVQNCEHRMEPPPPDEDERDATEQDAVQVTAGAA